MPLERMCLCRILATAIRTIGIGLFLNLQNMNVLVLGSGGREHAIAWSIKQSKECGELYVMPGNPGCAQIATCLNGAANDFVAVKEAVLAHNINLVVVGPEEPLVLGLADKFKADSQLQNVLFVGPGAAGARLEGSKEFAKEFMNRHNIPTAKFKSFTVSCCISSETFPVLSSISIYMIKHSLSNNS